MMSGGKFGLPRFNGIGSSIHFIHTVHDVVSRSAANSIQVRRELVPGKDDQLVEPRPES